MNRIRTFVFLFAATMFPMASNLIAEQPVQAKVPFAFSVADRMLPAGVYRIDHNGSFLHIEKRGDYQSVTLLATPGERSVDGRSFLSFEQVNGVFFLRRVVTPHAANSLDLELPEPSARPAMETIGHVGLGLGR